MDQVFDLYSVLNQKNDIVNIKVSTKFQFPSHILDLYSTLIHKNKYGYLIKQYNNMLIVKHALYTYTIIKKKDLSYHCNITGIKNLNEISNSYEQFLRDFFPNVIFPSPGYVIDSITSRFNLRRTLNLKNLHASLSSNLILNKKLNSHSFPSLKLRIQDLGCAQLYSSGKVILIAQKTEEEIRKIQQLLVSLIEEQQNGN